MMAETKPSIPKKESKQNGNAIQIFYDNKKPNMEKLKKELMVELEVRAKDKFSNIDVLTEKANTITGMIIAHKKLRKMRTIAIGELFSCLGSTFSLFEQAYSFVEAGTMNNLENSLRVFKKFRASNITLADRIALATSFITRQNFSEEQIMKKLDAMKNWLISASEKYKNIALSFQEFKPEKIEDFKRADDLVMQLYAIEREVDDKFMGDSDFFSGTTGSVAATEKNYTAYYSVRKQFDEMSKARLEAIIALGNAIKTCDELIIDEIIHKLSDSCPLQKPIPEKEVEDVRDTLEVLGKNTDKKTLYMLIAKIQKIAAIRAALKKLKLKNIRSIEEKLIEGLLEIDNELGLLEDLISMEAVKDWFSIEIINKLKNALRKKQQTKLSNKRKAATNKKE